MSKTMRAVVIHTPGGPEVLKLETRPVPTPQPGQVLIRIKAFGLNRSEMFTRQGHSPSVQFPRILGIEGCGIVESAPGGEFKAGQRVATAMGGLGRQFDGSYAEYTCVPVENVQAIESETVSWETLGAAPEMLQTAYGSLFKSLQLKKGDSLLIRGGTTSVGLAAAAIAKNIGVTVASTTRRPNRKDLLLSHGASQVFVDSGSIASSVRSHRPEGYTKILELIGTTTLLDSLQCASENGIVCMTGIVGNSWSLPDFSPMEAIPSTVCLTAYSGSEKDFQTTPLNDLVKQIEEGSLKVAIGKVFKLEEIVAAHELMDANTAGGKIVVLC